MPSGAVGGELSVLIAVSWSASEVDRAGEAMNSQSPPSFHGPLVSISPSSPVPVEVVEKLVHKAWRGRNLADRECRLLHAFQRCGKRLHVRDFARHQKLQGVFGARIVAEIDQPFVDDLSPGFGGDIAAKVDVELAGDLQIVGGPGIALRVEEIDAAAARDGDQRIGLCLFAVELHWLEVEAGEAADDFKMAKLFGADIHQEILAVRIFTVQALNGVLHRRSQFAVGAAELLKQHVAETGVGLVDPNGVHELFYMVIHDDLGG